MNEAASPSYEWCSVEPGSNGKPATFVRSEGAASVSYANGDTYEGNFNSAKKKHGHGVYTWRAAAAKTDEAPPVGSSTGITVTNTAAIGPARYDGQYVNGQRQGLGEMTFPNGDRYHGIWHAGVFAGIGTYYYANGDIYSGEWVDGQRHGEGVLLRGGDSSQLVGAWRGGSLATGRWILADCTSWHGGFDQRCQPTGAGVFYYPNGLMQQGEYVRERVDGCEDDGDLDAELRTVWLGAPATAATVSCREAAAARARPA